MIYLIVLFLIILAYLIQYYFRKHYFHIGEIVYYKGEEKSLHKAKILNKYLGTYGSMRTLYNTKLDTVERVHKDLIYKKWVIEERELNE